MNKPSFGAILFGLVPFAAVCLTVAWWDRVYPLVFGLPFNFFYLLLWLVLTPACMTGAYRFEMRRLPRAERSDEKRGTP